MAASKAADLSTNEIGSQEARVLACQKRNRAKKLVDQAHVRRHRTWHDLQAVKHANTPDIDRFDAISSELIQKIESLLQAKNEAENNNDYRQIRQLSADIASSQKKCKSIQRRRNNLVNEIRAASADHEAARLAYQQACEAHTAACQECAPRRADYESARGRR